MNDDLKLNTYYIFKEDGPDISQIIETIFKDYIKNISEDKC